MTDSMMIVINRDAISMEEMQWIINKKDGEKL